VIVVKIVVVVLAEGNKVVTDVIVVLAVLVGTAAVAVE
jgi:hypothetical protein